MRRTVITCLVGAALAALAPAAPAAEPVVLTGGAIPRIAPFTAGAVPCQATSCLAIAFRVRGEIGPRLTWGLTVLRPDGLPVYEGAGATRRGRLVRGLLEPASRPRCGRYLVALRVEDRDGYHVDATRTAVRRRACVSPRAGAPAARPGR